MMRRCFLSNETTGLTRLRSGQFYRQPCQLLSSSDYAHLLLAIVHFLQIQNHSAIVNHQNLQRPSLSFEMSLDFLIKKKKKKFVSQHGVGVEFVRVLPETHPPNLSNIFCECDSKDDVVRTKYFFSETRDGTILHRFECLLISFQTITCDCEATPALQLKASRRKADKLEVSHYRVNVNRFRARLNVICITEKLLLDLKCDGWPDVCIHIFTMFFNSFLCNLWLRGRVIILLLLGFYVR